MLNNDLSTRIGADTAVKSGTDLLVDSLAAMDAAQVGRLEYFLVCETFAASKKRQRLGLDDPTFAEECASAVLQAIVRSHTERGEEPDEPASYRDRVVAKSHEYANPEGASIIHSDAVEFVLEVLDDEELGAETLDDPIFLPLTVAAAAIALLTSLGEDDISDEELEAIAEGLDWLGPVATDLSNEFDDPEPGEATGSGAGLPSPARRGLTQATATSEERSSESLHDYIGGVLSEILGRPPHVDKDGDFALPNGSAVVFLRPDSEGPIQSVSLFSFLAVEIESSPGLLESLNAVNANFRSARVYHVGDRVVMRSRLAAETLSPNEVRYALDEMMYGADFFDTQLVKKYGGRTWLVEPGDVIDA